MKVSGWTCNRPLECLCIAGLCNKDHKKDCDPLGHAEKTYNCRRVTIEVKEDEA